MTSKQKLQRRIADIEKALSGEGADLELLRTGIIGEREEVVKYFWFEEGDGFKIIFRNGEVIGGGYEMPSKGERLTVEEAEIVANAYDIHEY